MTAFFMTSSGTDMGKTFVTSALARRLRERGCTVGALKPVISGFDARDTTPSDSHQLLLSLGRTPEADDIARISPWRFSAPLSPDMAAARENRRIDLDEVVGFCQDEIRSNRDILFIEGVGGVMVPLNEKATVLDWIAALKLPCLMVVGSYLGTISHSLTAVASLKARDIEVPFLVVNDTGDGPVPLLETARSIGAFLPDCRIFTFSRSPDPARTAAELDPLIDALLV